MKVIGFRSRQLAAPLSKHERICTLIPLFKDGRIYMPPVDMQMSLSEGQQIDMVSAFRDQEFLAWPYSGHDDMLDSLARIEDPDLNAIFPKAQKKADYNRARSTSRTKSAWAA